MNELRVKNWDEFQHYKKRNPPWIKLHRELLNDYAFSQLPDAARGHLVGIWILAAGRDGSIPDDAEWIARKLLASDPVDLELLVHHGFLYRDASDVLASCKQDASKMLAGSTGFDANTVSDDIPTMGQSASKVLATDASNLLATCISQTETETETETEFGSKLPGNPVVENSKNGTAQDGETWNERLAPLARRAGGEKHIARWLAWCKNSLLTGVSVEQLEARIGGLCELRDKGVFGEWIEKGVPMTPAIFERTPQLRQECDSAWIKYGPNRSGDIVKRLGVTL